jgi:lysophospholipase L1-like esterase
MCRFTEARIIIDREDAERQELTSTPACAPVLTMKWSAAAIVCSAVASSVAVGACLLSWRADDRRHEVIDTESIVMLGDSITAEGDWASLFADLPVVNAGRSGFTTAELVPVASEVAAARPRLLLILTGTNDIRDQRGPWWTRRSLGELVAVVRETSPSTRIVLQTVLPRADHSDEVVATNEEIRKLADETGVELLDIHPAFDDGTGALRKNETSDGIHLTDAGYHRWREVLGPIVRRR